MVTTDGRVRGRVTSADGTSIVFDRAGEGPAVILLTGNLDDGAENEPLGDELAAAGFTAVNLRRRGRAGSGDTQPYALDREIEDVAAVIAEAGGSAHLYGVSSGGALALEAAAAGLAVDRVVVYEVPYSIGVEAQHYWRLYVEQLELALTHHRRGEAVELFMRLAGASEHDIASARTAPMWPALEDIAPTLAYDAACLGDGLPPRRRLSRIDQPVLVGTGAAHDPSSPCLPAEFFAAAADAITAALRRGRRLHIEGQGHVADPAQMAAIIRDFLAP